MPIFYQPLVCNSVVDCPAWLSYNFSFRILAVLFSIRRESYIIAYLQKDRRKGKKIRKLLRILLFSWHRNCTLARLCCGHFHCWSDGSNPREHFYLFTFEAGTILLLPCLNKKSCRIVPAVFLWSYNCNVLHRGSAVMWKVKNRLFFSHLMSFYRHHEFDLSEVRRESLSRT